LVDALGHRRIRSGQEAGADPIGDIAKPQIEARGLDLAFDEGIGRQDQPGIRRFEAPVPLAASLTRNLKRKAAPEQ
jgi:hypothetical protein